MPRPGSAHGAPDGFLWRHCCPDFSPDHCPRATPTLHWGNEFLFIDGYWDPFVRHCAQVEGFVNLDLVPGGSLEAGLMGCGLGREAFAGGGA